MRARWMATVAAIVLLAACGGNDPDAAGVQLDAALGTAESDLGTILVDGEGRTLYVFDDDADGTSSCDDQCAENWPPLTGEVEASGDVDAALIGSTEREDDTTQVTYGGFPLYYFAADAAPGDVNGQGVGGVWWVVAPDGTKVTDDASAAAERTEAGY